jgi:hypothetical protein
MAPQLKARTWWWAIRMRERALPIITFLFDAAA